MATGYLFRQKVSGQKGRLAPCVHWPPENASRPKCSASLADFLRYMQKKIQISAKTFK